VLAYPSPRLAGLGLLLLAVAVCGYLWPVCFDIATLGALTLCFAAALDLWLTGSALKGRLELRREFPAAVTVARARRGEHVLVNRSRIGLRFRAYEDHFPQMLKLEPERWGRIAPRGEARQPVSITVSQRGEQNLGGAGLRVIAGLGLWVLQYRFDWDDKARVYPLIEELTRGDLFAHRRRLWGIGQHQSRKFGRGTEFDSLREYTPDDEYRTVNWKATARAGRPIVNQYQVEQSRDLMLLIDCGRLMHTEIAGRPRLDRYLDAAVHLAYLALSQKDRVGLLAFDADVQRYVAPGRRAVLFTDLVDSISSRRAIANLSRLARTHLPVVVILDDPAIEQLARRPVRGLDDAYVMGAAEQFISEKQRTLSTLRTRGCLIINVAAERLDTAVVNQYLEVKARNLL